jgi:hypothetical protein
MGISLVSVPLDGYGVVHSEKGISDLFSDV